MTTTSSPARALAVTTACVAAMVVLDRLGTGPLAPPAAWSPEGIRHWVAERGAAGTAMASIRLGAQAGCGLLGTVALTHLAAWALGSASGWWSPARALARVTPALARRAIGIALAAGTAANPAVAGAAPSDPAGDVEVPVLVRSDPHDVAPQLWRVAGPASGPVAGPTTATRENPPVGEATPDAGQPDPSPDRWIIGPGEHLWHVAAETVAEHLGHAPTRQRVASYWRRLVDANRDRLVDPDNPDLVHPGQELVLPRLD